MATAADDLLAPLDTLVGVWDMRASLAPAPAPAPRAQTTFEWLPGRRFLVQRWEVEHPAAPDGIAIIGLDPAGESLLQHYFDSRGVARVYEMTFDGRIWTLERRAEAPDFSQRFTASVGAGGTTIAGRWERSEDGRSWTPDFELVYSRA
jgi:hypothetical protein